MKEIIIKDKDAGQRLDKLCSRILKEAPKSYIYKMLRKKNIVLNDKKATGNEIVSANDSVKFYLSDETFANFSGTPVKTENNIPPIPENRIVYEDENIIICFKIVGELSQKVDPKDVSINERIVSFLETTQSEKSLGFTPGVVNRLDRNTCGLIVAGKNLKAQSELSLMFKDRTIDKYYLAICYGKMEKSIDAKLYLSKDEEANMVTISETEMPNSVLTHSIFKPLYSNDNYSLVKVKLETGKSHQIRAQLAYLGFPIVGDPKYIDNKAHASLLAKYNKKSQLLLAYELVFPYNDGILKDLSGKSIKTRLPKEFGEFIKEERLCHPGTQEDLEVHF